MTFKTFGLAAILLMAAPASAVELIVNGGFDSVTVANTTHAKILADGTANLANDATYITGWTVRDHSFGPTAGHTAQVWYYPTGAADVRRNDPGWNTGWAIYGPANGKANGFGPSANGGAIVEIDGGGDYRASLDQTLTGLTVGQTYTVSFSWAGAQQSCCTGTTTEQLVVGFGGSSQSTAVWNNPSAGFSGWFQESFAFIADGASQTLSFMAVGTPYGMPPVILLDGVSVQAPVEGVPEPASWALLLTGFGVVGTALRRRSRAVAA